MGKINSKVKGAVGERELAKELNQILGCSTRRGQQYSGIEGEDVVGLPGIHVECKRVEKLNIQNAVSQAVRDANGTAIPAVFHRRNRSPWLVTIQLDDLKAFAWAIRQICETPQETAESPSPVVSEKRKPTKGKRAKAGTNYDYT